MVYIVDHSTAESVLQMLEQAGVSAGQVLASGQMEIFSRDDACLKGGIFDPDRMIATLKQMEADALQAGWSALRLTGEMTWVLSELPGVERLIEYEAMLNYFLPDSRSLALCQYWEEKFDPILLLNVVRAHSLVISGDLVCENAFYTPPDEMLATMHQPLSADTYRNFLRLIEERTEQLDRLQESEERYRLLFDHMLDGVVYGQVINEEGQPPDWAFLAVNSVFKRMYGMQDITGKRITEMVPGIRQSNPEMFEVCNQVALTGQAQRLEAYVEPIQLWYSVSIMSTKKGTFVAIFEDITERKRAEAEIAHLASFQRLTPVPILEIDHEEKVLLLNPALRSLLASLRLEDPHRFISEEVRAKIHAWDGQSGSQSRFEVAVADHSFQVSMIFTPEFRSIRLYILDITERKRAEQTQADLFRAIAHDLANPVEAIQATIELIPEQTRQNQTAAYYLGVVERNMMRLRHMIQNLLDSTRIDAGELQLKKEPIDLAALVSDTCFAEEALLAGKDQHLDLQVSRRPLPLLGDRGKLEEVLANLVGNAYKFAPRGSTIAVRLSVEKQEAILTVRDGGPGIAAEHLPHLFDRFYQVENQQGTGLGLFIVQWLVEAHDGTISVQSEVGKGTTFTVRLTLDGKGQPDGV